jgi:hypothetical protein
VVAFPEKRTSCSAKPARSESVDLAAVEEATNGWHQSGAHPGTGNDRFFNYALSLRSAGIPLDEIGEKLEEQAEFARSPEERREQIPSIIQSLQQSYREPG